jgi:hypothetical protein
MDYGHELSFGTFLTPLNQRPEDVVALARLTEEAGLEYATFQDHPYQAAFLDTWTLMTWVLAQTTTLKVAPNVLNLPLRPPAVLARSAASLDLLSGGRFELALGAGAFWDPIVAMGGKKLTPGEAVTALSEAIDVIRQMLDTSTRRGVRVQGEHYQVVGAKRGPEPAHDMGIWLGAYKPRMLRLTGRKADGWLPTLAYLEQQDIGPANATIDEAARKAGRDPREVQRLLNIGPEDASVERLLPFVLEHGFSTFILAGDDPASIARFGAEVAPALREAVAAARAEAGTAVGEVIRGPKALEARRDGIAYEAVPASLRSRAVEPGDKAYAKVRSTYMRSGSPGLVLRPRDVPEVVDALAFARAQDVPLSVRSGGHGISGRSTNDGGVVIDLGALDAMSLDGARLRVGPGARWGEVAQFLAPHGLAMSSGDYGDVGVGGLATTGGVGFMGRKYGLTIDHVVAAELVLADGTFVRADAAEHPDLFWAVRGAGGNFGIVTALELDTYPVSNVVFSTMAFVADAGALVRWGALIEAAPRELTSFLMMGRGQLQLYNVFASDDTAAAVEALTPLLEIGPLIDQSAQLVPYAAIVPPHGGVQMGGYEPLIRSGLIDHVTPELASAMIALRSPFLQIRSVGGAVNDVDPMATAYAHRTQNFSVTAVSPRDWDGLMGGLTNGLYLSFETDQRPERLLAAFPEPTLSRLRELKATYDPANVFNQNFPIPPAVPILSA